MARRRSKNLFGGSSSVEVRVSEAGLIEFLRANKALRDDLVQTAQTVANEAQATASSAEEGAGGRITGYAAAGFSVKWVQRGRRPRVEVVSNADKKTFLAAHFHTQLRDGVGHLRAALYKVAPGPHAKFAGKYKYVPPRKGRKKKK